MQETQLLSDRAIGQTIRDKFLQDFVVNPENANSETVKESRKKIKSMSIYVGSQVVKALGGGMRQWHEAKAKLVEVLKSDIELGDTDTQTGEEGLAKMSLRVSYYAKFYSEMASLEANFVICLTYLSMMADIARSIEIEAFEQLGIAETSKQLGLNDASIDASRAETG